MSHRDNQIRKLSDIEDELRQTHENEIQLRPSLSFVNSNNDELKEVELEMEFSDGSKLEPNVAVSKNNENGPK